MLGCAMTWSLRLPSLAKVWWGHRSANWQKVSDNLVMSVEGQFANQASYCALSWTVVVPTCLGIALANFHASGPLTDARRATLPTCVSAILRALVGCQCNAYNSSRWSPGWNGLFRLQSSIILDLQLKLVSWSIPALKPCCHILRSCPSWDQVFAHALWQVLRWYRVALPSCSTVIAWFLELLFVKQPGMIEIIVKSSWAFVPIAHSCAISPAHRNWPRQNPEASSHDASGHHNSSATTIVCERKRQCSYAILYPRVCVQLAALYNTYPSMFFKFYWPMGLLSMMVNHICMHNPGVLMP